MRSRRLLPQRQYRTCARQEALLIFMSFFPSSCLSTRNYRRTKVPQAKIQEAPHMSRGAVAKAWFRLCGVFLTFINFITCTRKLLVSTRNIAVSVLPLCLKRCQLIFFSVILRSGVYIASIHVHDNALFVLQMMSFAG